MEIHVHSTRKYMYGVQQMCQCASEIGMFVWEISDTVVKSNVLHFGNSTSV